MSEVIEQNINQGTGAGGANTNANGLPFENMTDLSTHHIIIDEGQFSKTIQFANLNSEKQFIYTKQANFRRYMGDRIDNIIRPLHGARNPDEVYIDEANHNIFIIEKKNQNTSGSKCECIQTAVNKQRNYNRRIPMYNVVYIYCLSSWFRDNCQAELDDLNEDNIPVFWGNEQNYKNDMIHFMVNYK